MNRADRMLDCLQHPSQEWWTRHELFTRGGRFYLTNNAASELRERGYTVEQRYHEGNVEYRLVDIPLAPDVVAVDVALEPDGSLFEIPAPAAASYERDEAA